MLIERTPLEILEEHGAVLTEGHFVLTSGRHSRVYVNKDAQYPYSFDTGLLCAEMALAFAGDDVEIVVAPALGGIILSTWTAHALTCAQDDGLPPVLGVYAQREEELLLKVVDPHRVCTVFGMVGRYLEPGEELVVKKPSFVLSRGYDKLVAGKRALIVEDIVTTGGTVNKVVQATRAAGGEVVGVAALCSRGNVTLKDLGDVPKFHSLLNLTIKTWTEEECEIDGPCAEHVPINTDVGKGKEYLALHSH